MENVPAKNGLSSATSTFEIIQTPFKFISTALDTPMGLCAWNEPAFDVISFALPYRRQSLENHRPRTCPLAFFAVSMLPVTMQVAIDSGLEASIRLDLSKVTARQSCFQGIFADYATILQQRQAFQASVQKMQAYLFSLLFVQSHSAICLPAGHLPASLKRKSFSSVIKMRSWKMRPNL